MENLIQEAISVQYLFSVGYPLGRVHCRGGNGDGDCDGGWTVSSCDQFCSYVEGNGSLDDSIVDIVPIAHYAKCFNSSSGDLPNSRRFQFISQLTTPDMDPALPIMNVGNKSYFCRRMTADKFIFIVILQACMFDFQPIFLA